MSRGSRHKTIVDGDDVGVGVPEATDIGDLDLVAGDGLVEPHAVIAVDLALDVRGSRSEEHRGDEDRAMEADRHEWPSSLRVRSALRLQVVKQPHRFTRENDPQNRPATSCRSSFYQTTYIGSLKRHCRPNLG